MGGILAFFKSIAILLGMAKSKQDRDLGATVQHARDTDEAIKTIRDGNAAANSDDAIERVRDKYEIQRPAQ